jgi:hypothetical protein
MGAIALSLVIAMPLCADTTPKHTAKRKTTKQKAAPTPAPPPPPIVPLQPINLDQLPATPPHVTFANGQLSIVAQNSTLGEILRAVKAQTGAVVEMPGAPNDRVVGHLGPGPAREVLASLLNGTRFNYVLLGSATNPASLAHVILIAKTGGGAESQGAPQVKQTYSPPPEPGPPGGAPNPGTQVQAGGPDAAEDDDADQQDQNNQGDDQAADQGDQNQQNQQNQARTPEQLLQELQRQQQIQQQLGQQPGGPGGPRFPGLPQQPAGQSPEQ